MVTDHHQVLARQIHVSYLLTGKVFLGEIQQTAMGILEGVAHLVKSLIKDGCVGWVLYYQ